MRTWRCGLLELSKKFLCLHESGHARIFLSNYVAFAWIHFQSHAELESTKMAMFLRLIWKYQGNLQERCSWKRSIAFMCRGVFRYNYEPSPLSLSLCRKLHRMAADAEAVLQALSSLNLNSQNEEVQNNSVANAPGYLMLEHVEIAVRSMPVAFWCFVLDGERGTVILRFEGSGIFSLANLWFVVRKLSVYFIKMWL